MQWYDPLNKFMLLKVCIIFWFTFSTKLLYGTEKSHFFLFTHFNTLTFQHFDCSIANPPRVFEMVITPDLEYPIVCVNVRKGFDGKSLKLDMVNLNSTASWFNSDSSTGFGLETGGTAGPMDGYATVIPRHELMNVQAVVQLEKDTILVCYDSKIIFHLTNLSLKQLYRPIT